MPNILLLQPLWWSPKTRTSQQVNQYWIKMANIIDAGAKSGKNISAMISEQNE